jgi:hypothetical protein
MDKQLTKRQMGRPRKPPAELRNARVELRLTRAEKAKIAKLGPSKWVRAILATMP